MPDLNSQTWGAIEGLLLPLAVAIFQQPHWSNTARVVVAVLASLGAGLLTAWLNHQLNPRDMVQTVLAVLTVSQVAYRNIWQPTGAAKAVEGATSVGTVSFGDAAEPPKPPAGTPLNDITEETP